MTKILTCNNLTDALAALSAAVADRDGNIVFCEDRLTLLAERAVLSLRRGVFFSEVTTFSRFLSGERRLLSKQGSVMKIAALLEENEERLGCFKRGAAQAVYETIAQLSASRVDADALRRSAEEAEGLLKLKLTDLALILEQYEAFLRETGYVDESGYLALLPAAVEKKAAGANVVFFAFSSFTRQALEGVRAALDVADEVTAIFLDGDAAFCTHEAKNAFLRVVCERKEAAEERAVQSTLPRAANVLFGGLFSPVKFGAPPIETDSVFSFSAADEAEEIDTVCALIKKHISGGMRYRDFAVLVPDASRYLAVGKAFSAYRIPYFADRKRPFSDHFFCVFALAVLKAVSDGALPASVDAVAANVLFGEGGEEYRNYLLKFGGYRGAVRREIKTEGLGRFRRDVLVACRERMLAFLGTFPRRGTCAEFADGVRKLFVLSDAERVAEKLKEKFTGADREFLDLAPLEGVLKEMDAVAGGETLAAREFAALLESGLSSLGVSVIPQYADAVFVGDATESKFERAKVLFAIGLTEAIPRISRDTALISDRDIGTLRELQVEIEPAIAVVNARARESLGFNLCAFENRLYLSRPLRAAGAETQRSEILSYAERLFRLAPLPALFPFDCCERGPAALALLKYREHFLNGGNGGKYASLREALEAEWGEDRVEKLLSGGGKSAVPEAEELYFSGEVSPTLLEQYCECPYAGFALRALRLREREERTVQDTDAGVFVHTVLERVAPRFNSFVSEEECRAAAAEEAKALLSGPRFSSLSDTRSGQYTGGRLVAECAEVSAAAYLQLVCSRFRVAETEKNISLPGLSLRGRADRVDEAEGFFRVIDYKTGTIDDKPVSYYTGRKLQLQLYLLAASAEGKAAGAFYFPAAESFTAEGEEKYRMRGFFSKEDEVLALMDSTREEGKKSAFFEGGGRTDKGMSQDDFDAFLQYALLVSAKAEKEMRAGNIAPSPYEGACAYCKLLGACAFTGNARREEGTSCKDIVQIVRRERGEEI